MACVSSPTCGTSPVLIERRNQWKSLRREGMLAVNNLTGTNLSPVVLFNYLRHATFKEKKSSTVLGQFHWLSFFSGRFITDFKNQSVEHFLEVLDHGAQRHDLVCPGAGDSHFGAKEPVPKAHLGASACACVISVQTLYSISFFSVYILMEGQAKEIGFEVRMITQDRFSAFLRVFYRVPYGLSKNLPLCFCSNCSLHFPLASVLEVKISKLYTVSRFTHTTKVMFFGWWWKEEVSSTMKKRFPMHPKPELPQSLGIMLYPFQITAECTYTYTKNNNISTCSAINLGWRYYTWKVRKTLDSFHKSFPWKTLLKHHNTERYCPLKKLVHVSISYLSSRNYGHIPLFYPLYPSNSKSFSSEIPRNTSYWDSALNYRPRSCTKGTKAGRQRKQRCTVGFCRGTLLVGCAWLSCAILWPIGYQSHQTEAIIFECFRCRGHDDGELNFVVQSIKFDKLCDGATFHYYLLRVLGISLKFAYVLVKV
uniref:Uncharacterized protein n=1 Tax=Solanum lycopersicum TaxID=4081 RepID=A0A3Q7F9I1_SOLLC